MSDQVTADAAQFARIRHWKEYREQAAHLFPTECALRWFIRKHEPALVASGVLMKLSRGTYIDPIPFSAAALNLMRHSTACPVQGKQDGDFESMRGATA
jgi:hypothetical protein